MAFVQSTPVEYNFSLTLSAIMIFLTHPASRSLSRCLDGYVGNRCQHQDPCTYSSCKNGGSCRMVPRGNSVEFTCFCRPGFTDRLCLTPIDNACLSLPCRNGGTCDLVNLKEYKCRCPPGWSGKHCHIYYSHCSQNTGGNAA